MTATEPEKQPVLREVWPQLWLRRRDQACIAAGVMLVLLSLVVGWFWNGGWRGEVVEVEQAKIMPLKFRVDINSATWPEFAMLPNIGDALAKRIVAWRVEHGPFDSLEDLRKVRGVGPKTLDRIRPFLQPIETRK